MHAPTKAHLHASKNVLRYLKGTADLGLTFGGSELKLHGFVDSNFAAVNTEGKSVSGYCFFLCGAVISYCSRKQNTVAMSTAEAEYMALGLSIMETKYLLQLFDELGLSTLVSSCPLTIGEDNQACIKIAETTQTSFRTRHIDRNWHFSRDAILKGQVQLKYVPSSENPAYMSTKALRGELFKRHRATLMNISDDSPVHTQG